MASGTTPIWGRPYPLETDTPDVAADMHSLALSLETTPLYPTATSSSRTGVIGESVGCSGAITITLPASPNKGDMIRVYTDNAASGTSPTTVAASGGKLIFGQGLSAASSFKLGSPNAYATLQYNGTTWVIVSGQQDTGWVALTPASGWTMGSPAAQLRLIGDRVIGQGLVENVSGSASTTPLQTLPASVRPSTGRFLIVPVYNGSGGGAVTPLGIAINAPGTVSVSGLGINSVSYLCLDGVFYQI